MTDQTASAGAAALARSTFDVEVFGRALVRLWPHGDNTVKSLREGIIKAAPTVFPKWGCASPLVICHAMAQFTIETGGGVEMQEDMNYSGPRLLEVFPTHFTHEQAIGYAHQPRMIADQAYDGRMGNRLGTDDGWNNRGQGISQLTGRKSYLELAKKTGLDVVNHPEILIDPDTALECGIADFVMCGCLPYAERDSVLGVSGMLNLGHFTTNTRLINGYAMREHATSLWKHAMGVGVA
jgi:putative chitinase